MCVVAFAWSVHPRWRLVLIGNRDEFHARPAAALAHWSGSGIVAGRDLQAGGTWLGVDAVGRCAVVTNVRDPQALPALRSRGELPVSFLAGQSGGELSATALVERAGDYAPFNLLMVDQDRAAHVGHHRVTTHRIVAPGVYGISNGDFDAPWPKSMRLKTALSEWLTTSDDPTPLWAALAERQSFPDEYLPDTGVGLELERQLSSVFIAGQRYGTRCSTIVAIDQNGAGWIAERRFGPDGVLAGETRLTLPGR